MDRTCIITAKVSDTVWLFLMPFVVFLQGQGYEVKILAGEGRHGDDLRRSGLALEDVAFQVTVNPLRLLSLFIRVRKFLIKEEPVMVICNDPSASFITRLSARSAGIGNIIYFCHGLPFVPHMGFFERVIFSVLERVIRPVTYAIITMNKHDYEYARRRYRKAYKINGVGVDSNVFYPSGADAKSESKREYCDSCSSIIVAFVGRLIARKGVWEFLYAAKKIMSKGQTAISFILVGDGPLKEDATRFIQENSLERHVKLLGYVENMPRLLNAIDILVLPTYYAEGLPRVVMEAMSSGVPVIATNIRGCNDIIEDGKDGILIPPKDPGSIALALESLATDSSMYNEIRVNAYGKIRKYYSTEFVINQFKDIMENLNLLGCM